MFKTMNCFICCFCTYMYLLMRVNATESDVHYNESLSFIGYIRFDDAYTIAKHPTKPNSLLVGGSRALYTLNVDTNSSELIAGNIIIMGYREGERAQARFYNIGGLIAVNSTTVIVSDTSNACLRQIDLNNHKTSRYAGHCVYTDTPYSFGKDGNRLNKAEFWMPRGLLQTNTGIYAADGDKLRLVNDSDEVATPLTFQSWVKLNCLLEADSYIYITHNIGLARYDPITGDLEPLIGGNTITDYGFRDGPFTVARFNEAFGILALAPGLFLLVDSLNGVMRLVDINRNMVRTICSKDSIIMVDKSANGTLSSRCTEEFTRYRGTSVVNVGEYIYVSVVEIGLRKFLLSQDFVSAATTTADGTTTESPTTMANNAATETTIVTVNNSQTKSGDLTLAHTTTSTTEINITELFPSKTRNRGHTTPIPTSPSAVVSTLKAPNYKTSAFVQTWPTTASSRVFQSSALREINNSTLKKHKGNKILNIPLVIGLATAGGVTFFVVAILAGFFIRRCLRKRSDGLQPLIDDMSNNNELLTDSNYIILTENRTANHRVMQRANRPLPELPILPENCYELCNQPNSFYLEADDDNDNETNDELDNEYTGPYIAGLNTQKEIDPVSSTTPVSEACSDEVTARVKGDYDVTDDFTICLP